MVDTHLLLMENYWESIEWGECGYFCRKNVEKTKGLWSERKQKFDALILAVKQDFFLFLLTNMQDCELE